MPSDTVALIAKIKRDPEFHALVQTRSRLAWTLAATIAGIYFGFILLIAFAPDVLARPLGQGALTIGILAGVGVILAAFALTGLYVRRANRDFDAATARIVERAEA